MSKIGKSGIRAALADAEGRLAPATPADPPPDVLRHGYEAGRWPGHPYANLPPGCPITPLGVNGKHYYFLDDIGQIKDIAASEFKSTTTLADLCSLTPNWLAWAWPRDGKPKSDGSRVINGVEYLEAAKCLMAACKRKGQFEHVEKVRGRGAWTDHNGRLVWHAGETMWAVAADSGGLSTRLLRETRREFDGSIYATRPALPMPWKEPADDAAPRAVLTALQRWNWTRPDVDPILVLGWIGAAILSGALDWRPILFLVGDYGVGKSKLQQLVKACLGPILVQTSDTTQAGIYQKMGMDALPVAVDELEAGADNSKVIKVIELARLAASGALMFRGGQDHTGTEFRARSAFLFSAINAPPLRSQDLSRMALLTLKPLARSAERVEAPVISDPDTPRLLVRRLMDTWPETDASAGFHRTFARFARVLAAGGHGGRGQDTYGTLLTCAALLVGEDLSAQMGLNLFDGDDVWSERLATAALPEAEDKRDNWQACVEHMMTSRVEAWRSGLRATVGQLLEEVNANAISLDEANKQLAQVGLRVIELQPFGRRRALAVPNQSPLVAELFRGTVWGGVPGAAVWGQALGQAPPDILIADKTLTAVTIGGVKQRCKLMFVDRLVTKDEG